MREALHGRLPARYGPDSTDPDFWARLAGELRPELRILDVGAGATPCLSADRRPPGCHYVGLDVSREELIRAPAGSYDEIVVSDVCDVVPALGGRFDLVVSWFALEHVKPVATALDNVRSYLGPGGRLLATLAGTFSVASLLNRLIPERLAAMLLHRLSNRAPESVFRAHYDHCWHSGLAALLEGSRWGRWEVVPIYTGARYFGFSPVLSAAYLGYEEWICRNGRRNLAPYYLIDARVGPAVEADS